jgi:hypothetical protein
MTTLPSAATAAILGGGRAARGSRQQAANEFRIVNITGGSRGGGVDEALAHLDIDNASANSPNALVQNANSQSNNNATEDRIAKLKHEISALQVEVRNSVPEQAVDVTPEIAQMEEQIVELKQQLSARRVSQADSIVEAEEPGASGGGGFRRWFGMGGDDGDKAAAANATVSAPPSESVDDEPSSEVAESEVAGSEVAESEVAESEVAESEVAESEAPAAEASIADDSSSVSSMGSSVSTTSLLASGNLYLTLSKMFITETAPHENQSVAEVLWNIGDNLRKLNETLAVAVGKMPASIHRGRSRSTSSTGSRKKRSGKR